MSKQSENTADKSKLVEDISNKEIIERFRSSGYANFQKFLDFYYKNKEVDKNGNKE